jgi:hypothetical protein
VKLETLRRCGEALYGERWQSPLARDLGVAIRTVQRWTAADCAVPPGVWPEIDALLEGRAQQIAELRQDLANERVAWKIRWEQPRAAEKLDHARSWQRRGRKFNHYRQHQCLDGVDLRAQIPDLWSISDDRTGPVDLAFIGRALQRLATDVAAMPDEMRVQTAMILRQDETIGRQDATLNAVLEQLRAMVAQHQHTADRVRALEDKIEDAPIA